MAPLGTQSRAVVFTDIEGSTRLLRQLGSGYPALLARHFDIVVAAFRDRGGEVVSTEGDGLLALFPDPREAVAACGAAQLALLGAQWPQERPRVRMAVHVGDVSVQDGRPTGLAIHQGARVVAAGHGDQVLLTTAAAQGLAVTEGLSAKELGAYRVRDFDLPERLFQLEVPGLAADFPALRAVPAEAHNLPLLRSSFIGRELELAELGKLVDVARLVTVLGPGGAGKTRLALELIRSTATDYDDGATAVLLAGVSDPDAVDAAVAEALGVVASGSALLRPTLVRALSRRRGLVLLDNCEQVAGAVASLLDEVLDQAPDIRIVVTSRVPVDVTGEVTYPLRTLDLPRADAGPEEALGSESVRLFVERAREVLPGFVLDHGAGPLVARVCRQLDGLPLAIELAAARVRTLPLATLADRLEEGLGVLGHGPRTADQRQRTVHDLVDWSYQLLEPAEQVLFARISVFRGTFDLEAIEAVCGEEPLRRSDVLDLTDSLVRHSLVAFDGEDRYRMLVVIREVAAAHLAESGDEATRSAEAHLRFYADRYRRLGEQLEGPEQLDQLRRLDADIDNVRAALTWGLLSAGSSDPAERLAYEFRGYLFRRGLLAERDRWLALVRAEGDERFRLRTEVARLSAARTEPATLARLNDIAERARAAGNHELRRSAVREIALSRLLTGKPQEAEWLLEAELLEPEPVTPAEERLHRYVHALAVQGRADWSRAATILRGVLTEARSGQDWHLVAHALQSLAVALNALGELPAAREALAESLEVADLLGLESARPTILGSLAANAFFEGDIVRSNELNVRAGEAARRIGEMRVEYGMRANLAEGQQLLGQVEPAETTFRACREWAARHGDAIMEMFCLRALGRIALDRGDLAGAKEALTAARDGYRAQDASTEEAATVVGLAWVALAADDPPSARRLAEEALRLHPEETEATAVLALAAGAQGDGDEAARLAADALAGPVVGLPQRLTVMAAAATVLDGEQAARLASQVRAELSRTGIALPAPVRRLFDAKAQRSTRRLPSSRGGRGGGSPAG